MNCHLQAIGRTRGGIAVGWEFQILKPLEGQFLRHWREIVGSAYPVNVLVDVTLAGEPAKDWKAEADFDSYFLIAPARISYAVISFNLKLFVSRHTAPLQQRE